MSKPYDLKKDPKFLARVKKLEGNNYSKLFKVPLEIQVKLANGDTVPALVVCIGINDTYLIVVPSKKSEGSTIDFEVAWTKSDGFTAPTALHEQVSTQVINWTMMESNGDSEFNKVRHGTFDIKDVAIRSIGNKYGEDYFENKKELRGFVQGTVLEGILNPYHR